MRFRTGCCAISAATTCLVFAQPAHAERPEDKAWLQAGAFFPTFDSTAQIDVPDTSIDGTVIDFERDLDLAKRKTVPDIEGGLRITNRLRLEGGFFSLKRNGETKLDRDIRWEETIYPATADVKSGFRTDIYRVAVGYSFVKSPNLEVGARIGAHVTDFKMFIEGNGTVDGETILLKNEAKNRTIPLPNVGLYANANLSRVFTVSGGANWFQLKVDDYKGRLIDLSAGVSARVLPHVGIGVRYRYVDYTLHAKASDWEGRVDYTFHGPAVFLEAAF